MNDAVLRTRLIRLASEHPEFRKDLLPLIKSAGCEKLPEGGMRDNCEKKKEEGAKSEGEEKKEASSRKRAGMATIRRMTVITVRIMSHRELPGGMDVQGVMAIDFGGGSAPDSVRFTANVISSGGQFIVTSFSPMRAVSGGGAEVLTNVLKAALQEAFQTKGQSLLGSAAEDMVPDPGLV